LKSAVNRRRVVISYSSEIDGIHLKQLSDFVGPPQRYREHGLSGYGLPHAIRPQLRSGLVTYDHDADGKSILERAQASMR
jgi:hypothetical protein